MAASFDPHLLNFFKSLSRRVSLSILLIGGLVLFGWALDIAALKSVLPGLVTMKPNTALAFILAGTSLWLLQTGQQAQWARRVAQGCASLVVLIGLLTLSEYLFGRNIGIDQWLFEEPAGAVGTFSPGRMAPTTALNFLLLGLALLLLDVETRRGHRPAQILALTVGLIAFLAFLGYVYGVASFYGLANYTKMAVHTALAFIVLSIAVFCARPDRGLTAVITSDSIGGVMARRLLPMAIVIPAVLGWLRLMGQQAGFYDTAFGTALFAATMIFALVGLIGWTAVGLNRIDTERRRAEEELARQSGVMKSVLTSIGEGVVVADPNGKFMLWNPAAERIVGLGPTELPPREWSKHYGVYLPDQTTPYPADQLPLTRALRGESVDEDEQFLRHAKAPQGISLSVTGRPLRDESGTLLGGVVVFRDITERKNAEEEIRKANAQLEAANKELEAFSYSVSHDLRAPLRAIDGFSQTLLEDYANKLDTQGKDALQRVRAASQRMAQLIDDMLNLARVSRSEIHQTRVDLSAMAQAIAAELKRLNPERRVEFVIVPGLVAEGDTRLLRIVLENLLGNAWKFTEKKPRATIEFGIMDHDRKPAYFVRDDGAGFDMTYAHKLFGVFQRLHSLTEFPGTGVGLATVQRIIHRHGGRVWAEGAVEKGATFYFML